MRHLEEGEIHAWLDEAVAPDEAARIEAHVAGCARCAEEVATARGLIAGASRILLALDSVPGGVIPGRPADASIVSGSATTSASALDEVGIQRTKAAERRHAPWFSRPWARVAAGLVLAAGIGTVAARQKDEEARRLTVEFSAESATDLSSLPFGRAVTTDSLASAERTSAARTANEADSGRPIEESSMPVGLPAPVPAVSTRAPAPPPPVVPQGAAFSAAAAKVGQASPPSVQTAPAAPAPSAPSAPSVPELPAASRAEAQTRLGAAGGAAGAVASAPAIPPMDTTRRIGDRQLRLSTVVVTGAAEPTQSIRMPFTVARAPLAGSCFAIALDAPSDTVRGEMPLPRTMRIRLADLQNIATDAVRTEPRAATALADSLTMRRTLAQSREARREVAGAGAMAPAVEPLETVEWEIVPRDSVVARRLTGIDVVVLRLAIAGDTVTGTARAQTATTPPVRVNGRRISCDGSL